MKKDKKESQPAVPIAASSHRPWGISNIVGLAGFLLTLAIVMGGLVVWLTDIKLDEHSAKMDARLQKMQHDLSNQIRDSFQESDRRIAILRDVVQLIVYKTEDRNPLSKSDANYMKDKLKQVRLNIEPLLDKTKHLEKSVALDHDKLSRVRKPITLRDDGTYLIRFYESTAPDFKPSDFDVHGDTCETKSFDLGIPGYSAKICHKHLVSDGEPRLEVVITRDYDHREKKRLPKRS